MLACLHGVPIVVEDEEVREGGGGEGERKEKEEMAGREN